jgi:hypothetical protein
VLLGPPPEKVTMTVSPTRNRAAFASGEVAGEAGEDAADEWGLSEKTGSPDVEEQPENMAPAKTIPQKTNPSPVSFQNNFIMRNPCKTGEAINTFV